MPPANFRLAPPPTTIDGLHAVPVDFGDLHAAVTFDGAASSARVDATVTYTVGPDAGCPLFDLRQSIDQAWLDGAPVDPSTLAAHDVGLGALSSIRIVDAVQPAGSVHTLRLVYALGTPDAQLGGSYPPVLAWSAGPRLRWSLGMSDLNAGRYLEAWLPSNLIFDQFPVELDITLNGTLAAHSLITNGQVTVLAPRHWRVRFADHFSPMGQMLEIRASDTVEQAAGTAALPLSGSVAIEAWKPVGSTVDLAARIADLGALLVANENDYGRYQATRFVAFFHGAGGGMEYNGATTTATGALAHETFHSWFARGVTPSSQSDGWWDEGFTTFRDGGADDPLPFDFADDPIVLCSRRPFQRTTAPNAYADGSRFFKGMAATVGVAGARTAMRALYERHRGGPLSTAMLEEHIVSHTGAASLVDAFHRFVYGLGDPSPAPQLWLRDAPGHAGADPWGGEFWNSPDLWIRNADDGGTGHQAPLAGRDNWFYARVRNAPSAGACRHFVVTFAVKEYAGTQFAYPADFLPSIAARAEFDIGPGEERIVSARWPRSQVPATGTHPCLLAAVLARGDRPAPGAHVWEHANLAQKNLTVVELRRGAWTILPVVVGPAIDLTAVALEVWRDPTGPRPRVALVHKSAAFFPGRRVRPLRPAVRPPEPEPGEEPQPMDCGGRERPPERAGGILGPHVPERIALRFPDGVELPLRDVPRARVRIGPPAGGTSVVGLKVTAPAEPGTFLVHLVQREGKRIVGGVALEARVI
jgi:hypothetical protein